MLEGKNKVCLCISQLKPLPPDRRKMPAEELTFEQCYFLTFSWGSMVPLMLNPRSCIPTLDGKYQILKLIFFLDPDHFCEISLPTLLKMHPEKFIIGIIKGLLLGVSGLFTNTMVVV